jgi:hypothetical protein
MRAWSPTTAPRPSTTASPMLAERDSFTPVSLLCHDYYYNKEHAK